MDPRTDPNETLAPLIARVALGDRAALAALYRASSAHLFGVILRIQTDRAHAEDLLQDVYVNIWRAASSYDAARAQPLAWLTSVARNRAIDALRRRKTEVETVSRHAPARDGDDEVDLLDQVASDAPGPVDLLQQAAARQHVTQCLGGLSAEQQQCVALTYYQGLSHAEVAAHLRQPLGTVKSWVRRALQALRDCLGHAAAVEV